MKIEYTKNGRQRTINARVGKILIGRGLARAVGDGEKTPPTYETRMLTAVTQTVVQAPAPTLEAPYGYKADGTPRKRPGRQAAQKANEEE
jgi:hypothetical protein